LEAEEEGRRRLALACLEAMGKKAAPAVPALLAALDDPADEVRRGAARILAGLGERPDQVLPVLYEALGDREPFGIGGGPVGLERGRAREAAVGALVRYGETARAWLLEHAGDTDPAVRVDVARALARLGERERAARLLRGVLESDAGLLSRVEALETLARIDPGSEVVLATAVRFLDDPLDMLRRVGWETLRTLGPRAAPALPRVREALARGEGEAVEVLTAMGAAAAPAVADLAERLPHLRERGLRALAAIGREAVPALTRTLGVHERLRYRAVRALAAVGPDASPAVPALLSLLDARQHVDIVLEALERIGPPARGVYTDLEALLQDESVFRKDLVRRALASIRGELSAP
jgi:HEAT repeat protein